MEFIFTEMFIEKFSTFHMAFVQISEFDWLPGRLKWLILEKILNNLLLRDHKVDEANTLHICLRHYPLGK